MSQSEIPKLTLNYSLRLLYQIAKKKLRPGYIYTWQYVRKFYSKLERNIDYINYETETVQLLGAYYITGRVVLLIATTLQHQVLTRYRY